MNIWRAKAWNALKYSTVFFAGLGFVAGSLSLLRGDTISINGSAIEGWRGVWTITFALGAAGVLFGLIGFLVLSAIGIAARNGR